MVILNGKETKMNENDFDREFKLEDIINLVMTENAELLERLKDDVQ